MNKVILSIILVSIITAATLTATVPQAYAKKSSEWQAGYRDGAVDGQKAADKFDAGKSSGVDANNPPPCPNSDPDYCKGYKRGYSDQAISALE